jgi:hypothetical protein
MNHPTKCTYNQGDYIEERDNYFVKFAFKLPSIETEIRFRFNAFPGPWYKT